MTEPVNPAAVQAMIGGELRSFASVEALNAALVADEAAQREQLEREDQGNERPETE